MNFPDEVYREFILDHYRDPANKGKLDDFDIKKEGLNPHCGDRIEVFLELENNRVTDISHDGSGCAISQAGASLITEEVKGLNKQEIKNITKKDMVELLQIPVDYTREKCAMLALKTIKKSLDEK